MVRYKDKCDVSKSYKLLNSCLERLQIERQSCIQCPVRGRGSRCFVEKFVRFCRILSCI